ncbi:hypothetical protein GCK32_019493, partial [Trichostrongylus colubriformis]
MPEAVWLYFIVSLNGEVLLKLKIMNSSRSDKPNFFQKLKSWRSNHEKNTSSCTEVVVYTGDS